jgi:hypothetical protein
MPRRVKITVTSAQAFTRSSVLGQGASEALHPSLGRVYERRRDLLPVLLHSFCRPVERGAGILRPGGSEAEQ